LRFGRSLQSFAAMHPANSSRRDFLKALSAASAMGLAPSAFAEPEPMARKPPGTNLGIDKFSVRDMKWNALRLLCG